jgi:hypothetical protein
MATAPLTDLTFAQRERFRFVESTLLWEGGIQRARVSEIFGVARNHVTKDLRDYETSYPDSLVFEPRQRAYVPGPHFKPRFASDDPAEYLALQLTYAESGSAAMLPLLAGGPVPTLAIPMPDHGISKPVLQVLVQAIRQKRGVEALYHSMSAGRPTRRTLWPHALMHTGVRWYVRAFDKRSQEFRDFALQRMEHPTLVVSSSPQSTKDDEGWQTSLTLEVIPHSALSAHRQQMVAREFGMRASRQGPVWAVRLRRCLVGYFARRYGLDQPKAKPPMQVVTLRNLDMARPWFLPGSGR